MKNSNSGFSFIEVILATALAAGLFAALIWLTTTTRAETGKSVNYLRALQLAQETVDWLQATPSGMLTPERLRLFEGSLVDPQTEKSTGILPGTMTRSASSTIAYPDDYCPAWFYRKITLEKPEKEYPGARFLRRVTIEIFWNEGKRPTSTDSLSENPDRMRKISLSALLLDENEYY